MRPGAWLRSLLGRSRPRGRETSPREQYRFLVRSWTAVTDADLAARLLGTEFFKEQLEPARLPVEAVKSWLVLAPHQDDEVIGAGGTLALASAAGAAIHILFTTDGEQREAGDTRSVRDAEAREVCRLLSATREYLGISNTALQVSPEHVTALSKCVARLRPQVILAPWLLDSPPKHRVVNHLLWLANRTSPLPDCEIWGYQVHNALYPNGYVEITDVAERKRQLIRCYRSQLDKYYRYDHTAMGLAAWNSRFLPDNKANPRERYAEVFFAAPAADTLRLVEQYYLRDLNATYKGKRKLVEQMRRLQNELIGGGKRAKPDAAVTR